MKSSVLVCACAVAAAALPARAVIVGTIDTFQDGTVQGWSGANPANVPTGGTAGTGDAFLKLSSVGVAGPAGRPATYNSDSRWAGDYLAAGVTRIEADCLNMGTATLQMRLVLFQGSSNRYTSTVASSLPADGAWHHFLFAVDQGSLTRVGGTLTYSQLMTNVTSVMLRHQAGAPAGGGTPIATTLGIDNIQVVPAPGAAFALGLAFTFGGRRGRRA